MHDDSFLEQRLQKRRDEGSFRMLTRTAAGADFSSNDYLGIAHHRLLTGIDQELPHGSTGSRLLTGNSEHTEAVEHLIASFHEAETATIFGSGYDANLGLLGTIPQKGDTILYDSLSHASIRDGIRLSLASSFSFAHNDLHDLERRIASATGQVFVVTESVFSMDGDTAPIHEISRICEARQAHLVIDEAHATGVIGNAGEGLVQEAGLQQKCFARMHTFGKALGCHGAVILGSGRLRQYLVNFCRPFIYTTAPSPMMIKAIEQSYHLFPTMVREREILKGLIEQFQQANLPYQKLRSNTPIQGIIIPGNSSVKAMSVKLADDGFDVRPILYPTVPKDGERLRITLHSFNRPEDLSRMLDSVSMSA